MELMITVAIIGILSAIAIPSYNSYVTDSKRSEAKKSLLELGQFMERYYTANDRYNKADDSALTVDALPFQTLPKDVDDDTTYYRVSVVESTKDTYELALIPSGPMDGDDCGNYTLDQTGEHTPSAGNATCW